jgi:cytochrome c5
MKNKRNKALRALPVLAAILIGSVLIGCSTGPANLGSQETAVAEAPPSRSGAEIWGDTCNRCHNYRDPGTYSDVQWDVAMMHMRVRARLNGADARAVLEFLQASN